MKILTIDFETYYSQTYSLSKMTTEEYVRGDEFEVIGVEQLSPRAQRNVRRGYLDLAVRHQA